MLFLKNECTKQLQEDYLQIKNIIHKNLLSLLSASSISIIDKNNHL